MTEMSEKSIGEEANALLHHYIACAVCYAREAYNPHPTANGLMEAYGRLVYARDQTYSEFPIPSLLPAIDPVHYMLVNELRVAADKVDDWFVKALLDADPIQKKYGNDCAFRDGVTCVKKNCSDCEVFDKLGHADDEEKEKNHEH